MVTVPANHVQWEKTHRLVLSRFPPIDLFDDVADPRDWEALAIALSKTNPRIYEEIGDLSLVPVNRRLSGDGASWVMAAFTHISIDKKSRFSDGSYGVYYAADTIDTAFHEHAFHMARFYDNAGLSPGWISQMGQLVGSIDAKLTDIRGNDFAKFLSPSFDSYPAAQAFAQTQKQSGSNGIVYPSQRSPGGQCFAAFYPDVVSVPAQADHFRYHWNGTTIDFVQKLTGAKTMYRFAQSNLHPKGCR